MQIGSQTAAAIKWEHGGGVHTSGIAHSSTDHSRAAGSGGSVAGVRGGHAAAGKVAPAAELGCSASQCSQFASLKTGVSK